MPFPYFSLTAPSNYGKQYRFFNTFSAASAVSEFFVSEQWHVDILQNLRVDPIPSDAVYPSYLLLVHFSIYLLYIPSATSNTVGFSPLLPSLLFILPAVTLLEIYYTLSVIIYHIYNFT